RDVNDNLLMTSDVLSGSVKLTADESGRPAVLLPVKDTDKFYDVTKKVSKMTNNNIVIWLDFDPLRDSYATEKSQCGNLSMSRCLSSATVSEAFSSDVIIQGNFTIDEAKDLVELINSGAMPTKLNEISSKTVDASFGNDAIEKTLLAGIVGLSIVVLLIITIYRFSGLIASINLIIYATLCFLVYYLIDGVLTLPGIAAMILGLGVAVDANVISFERIKDELKVGKNLKEAFKLGNKMSFSSILDANITTIIIAIILFIFGQSSIKGYATMLLITVILTVLIMVFVVRWVLSYFVKIGSFEGKENWFVGLNKKKISGHEVIPFKKIDFVKNKFFIISIIIVVIGGGFALWGRANLGVDFSGGTNIDFIVDESINVSDIEKDLRDKNYTISKIESYDNTESILIKEILNKDDIEKLDNYFTETYNVDTNFNVVSNIVQQQLIKNGLLSLCLAFIGIIIYVTLRFKYTYAVSGIVALIHDVLIVGAVFVIFNIEISSIFIAAILTIIGYSINDTIVTFDRVRENCAKIKGKVTDEVLTNIVNDSVRLTLFRTLLTTITTIIPVICLILIGSFEIINFNIALLVGFIAGVYSSIYISNQLWLWLEKKSNKKIKKEKKTKDNEPDELIIKGING
ncbi:MAG: protein translocase subunit SecF, partial [bacterium]|nr:protein translocase subunit SecF [bacterium]